MAGGQVVMSALSDALIAGSAALFCWVLLSQLHPPVIGGVLEAIRRSWIRPLLACSWCSGFWLSVILVPLAQWGRWDWILTPLAILAAAALAGFVGSLTPGMEVDDDDDDE